jgi:hypothetical protein
MSEQFTIAVDGCDLAGEPWAGGGELVLLHEGVADRRGCSQKTKWSHPVSCRPAPAVDHGEPVPRSTRMSREFVQVLVHYRYD